MKKLGKIFDPTEHKLANGCVEFAQAPQSLVFEDFVRIYFSTRKKDSNGKFLSHISFVDMDKKFKTVLKISRSTVIPLGNLGCFDEHGIFPINPVRNGNKIFAYTCGWSRRVSVSVETSIGLAISENDGLTFKKVGTGPIMSSTLKEPFLVGDAFVQIYDNTFHMWYIYGTLWSNQQDEPPARVYKIAHATSDDGINWTRDSQKIVADKLNEEECQALPSVIHYKNKYHMFFCYRHATDFRNNSNRSYRIGYAYSNDLNSWTRDDGKAGIDVSSQGWDSEMQCYPHVFNCDDKIYLLYNGNEFGRFGFGLAELE
ncbi:MAG: hypothetical protein JST18_01770 [Bacteroidetes bacterium]|nr:hypothetical protein [Bacteroidota bacterium]